jgi:DNA mismatch endonuclease, patch repair protein
LRLLLLEQGLSKRYIKIKLIMADNLNKETRSYNMSRIGAKNTRPELAVRKALFARGFRYKLHDKRLPGKPDMVLVKYRTVIFIHGCFWHSHDGCSKAVMPKSNTEYWTSKILNNTLRDKSHTEALMSEGWQVIVVWECELKKALISELIEKIIMVIKK